MKDIDKIINELNYCLPYNDNDLRDVYRKAQINLLLELSNMVKGYPVNGLVRGIITEEQLTDKLIEVSND